MSSPNAVDGDSKSCDTYLRMETTDLTTVDPDMAILEDLANGQAVLLPNRHISVIGLTIDENLTCVESEFAENDCVIALYHVTRKPNGDWLIPNPDLPCLVNDEEVSNKVLLSQGTVVHVGDRFMRYHMPVSRRAAASGAPPKPSRMRSNSVVPVDVSASPKTNRSFSITMADEWCIIDIESEIASRQERLRSEGWCVVDGITSSDSLIEAITSAEQLCSIVSSHICHQTMVYTETTLSTHEIDDLFKFIKAMGPGNEMVMTKFVLEYHSHMNEEENMGRALHKPVIALLTDFLKVTLEPLDQTEFWLRLLASFSDVRDNLQYFLEIGTPPVVLGAMAASMASESVQENGCRILANVSSLLPNHNKKGPIRESAVELVLMAVRIHIDNANVIRPACRTLANVTQTYATLIGRVLTPEPEDTISEDRNAVENLARWLGIMEVIQEYGLPIIDVIAAKYAVDVVIQAECRRVVVFFRNNSFQTDSSEDSSTDLPHLEMQKDGEKNVSPLTSSDSNRSSISSLSENDVVHDTNSINKVLNQVMINCSSGSTNDQSISAGGMGEPCHSDRFSTISANTVTDLPIEVPMIVVSDVAAEATIHNIQTNETFLDVKDETLSVEEIETVQETLSKKGDSLPKKEKRSTWKWFTGLFSAKDKDESKSVTGTKDEKSTNEKQGKSMTLSYKQGKALSGNQITSNVNQVDLDYLVRKNNIYADMVESFEELYETYVNQDECNQFTNIDLNNDDTNQSILDTENPKSSTRFVSLQKEKFTLERQKQRLKTLKSVAKGIVKKTKRDSYTINQTDSTGMVTDKKLIDNAKDNVIPTEPVQTLKIQITSTQKHEHLMANKPNQKQGENSGLESNSTKGPEAYNAQSDAIILPSVQALAKKYETDKKDKVTPIKQTPKKPENQSSVTEITFDEERGTSQSGLFDNVENTNRILPSVQALAKIYEKRKSKEIIPITNPAFNRLRRHSVEIKSGEKFRRQSGSFPISQSRETSELTMAGNEGMTSSTDQGDSYGIRGENDLVESGEIKVFVTEKDVHIPGGIGASTC